MKNVFFRNVQFIKDNAVKFLTNLGYENIGYEGTDADLIFGGKVWYQATHKCSPNVVLTLRVRKQGETLKNDYNRQITGMVVSE